MHKRADIYLPIHIHNMHGFIYADIYIYMLATLILTQGRGWGNASILRRVHVARMAVGCVWRGRRCRD